MTTFCSQTTKMTTTTTTKKILKKYTKHKIMKTTFTPVIHPVQVRKVSSNVRLSAVTTNDAFLKFPKKTLIITFRRLHGIYHENKVMHRVGDCKDT